MVRSRFALVLLAALAFPAGAHAALPQQSGAVDLLTQVDGSLVGATAGDGTGEAIAPAGDVNGDGVGDMIVGSATRNAAVVFGSSVFGALDTASLGARGFRIVNGGAIHSVAGVGDQNGDGLADVAVADSANHIDVIFGKADGATVNPTALGTGGFTITGTGTGPTVGSAGDMNGDGVPEIVIGDPTATFGARTSSGLAYVLFGGGHPGGSSIAVSAIGAPLPGFRIDGAAHDDGAGSPVASAGDFNGDGRGDVLIAAQGAVFNARSDSGAVYVVYGKSSLAEVDLAATGFTEIGGQATGNELGRSISPAGDINGDGLSDVVVGSSNANGSSGSAYVVFGSASAAAVDAAALGTRGYRIDGIAAGNQAARSLGGGGDVNGDGRPDVVVGALFADPFGRSHAGAMYVVYGKTSTTTVALASLGTAGFAVAGAVADDYLGRGVAMADVTGDGRADAIGGAENTSPPGRTHAGTTYVVQGFGPPSFALGAQITGTAGTPIAAFGPTAVQRTGTATWSISPALPAGLSLDAATGTISGTPTAAASATETLTMTDLAGSASAAFTVTVAAAPAAATPIAAPIATPVFKNPTSKPPKDCSKTRRGTKRANRLNGTAGSDRILGGAGNDTIDGKAGNDCLFGEAGNDRITGGKGKDTISGGAGNDRIDSRDGVKETIDCGKGRDRVRADKSDKLVGCEKRVAKL